MDPVKAHRKQPWPLNYPEKGFKTGLTDSDNIYQKFPPSETMSTETFPVYYATVLKAGI